MSNSTLDVTQPFDRPQKLLRIIDNGDGTYSLAASIAALDSSLLSGFGTLETGELTPVLQLDFVYGINTQTGVSTVANSATVDTDNRRLRLQSGTNAAGSAVFQSRKPAKYRPGQGVTARFTPLFTTGKANSTQILGAGNSNNGYFLGYNGTTFGILHRNGGSDTWIPQSTWNGDKVDGSTGTSFTYDPTKGTPVMIKYPFLGYGNINFYMQHPTTSRWVLIHTIFYSNLNTAVQVVNPTLSFYGQALNSGNTSNLIMYCGSVGFFLSGMRSFVGNPRWAADSNKTGVTTEVNIITLKNATTYNGVTNRGLIRINSISISSSAATGVTVLRMKFGATLGGSPSYTTINGTSADGGATITNGNSITSYDVAGTTVTGGLYEWGITLDNPNSQVFDMLPYDIFIVPGEIVTFSVVSTISSSIGITVNFTEDI